MYTSRYRRQRNPIRPPVRRSERNRNRKRHNHYESPNPRPSASERDRRTYGPVDPARDRSRITRGVEETEDEKPEVDKAELNTKLHVTGIDLHIEENVKDHHTEDYSCTKDEDEDGKKRKAELVIRRGQAFKMTINFDRPYNIKKNDVTLLFNLGDDYKPHKGMNVCCKVDETGKKHSNPKKWGATLVEKKDNSITVEVFVSVKAPIGEWEISVRTVVDVVGGKDLIWQYNHTCDYIKIIFNPFCKHDLVYVEDETLRDEIVMNCSGAVYTGSYKKVGVRTWFFGQFEDTILDTCLHLVRKAFGFEANPAMASPAAVARAISQIVNAPDDAGVLVGNWSGDYAGGKKPTAWNGSVKILKEYMSSGGKPVRYGQCWVFSGVVTTVCRAIGLPCRSVTNHSSAHNTDQERLSIDVISQRNSAGEWEDIKRDSIWNFHVWNECWFRTPSLNTDKCKYDGWQVIDATPQEYSDGVYCCGPAPVIAIKLGHLEVGKDTSFVFAEVNADKVCWKENVETGRLFERKRNRNIVGKCISTHKPTGKPYKESSTIGSFFSFFTGKDTLERLELSDIYKFPEGSEEEREICRMAEKKFRKMGGCYDDDDEDSEHECEEEEPVEIEFEEEDEEAFVGEGFDVKLKVKNKGKEDRTMKLIVRVLTKTYYDSVCGVLLKKTFENVKLKAGDTEKFKIEVDEKKANERPEHGFNFEIKAVAEFKESDHIVSEDMDYRLRRTDLTVKGDKKCRLDETMQVEVSYKNPLKVPLTKCEVDLEGGFTCVEGTKDSFKVPNIAPGETWKTILKLRPKKHQVCKPDRDLCIGFDSKELGDIMGMYCATLK